MVEPEEKGQFELENWAAECQSLLLSTRWQWYILKYKRQQELHVSREEEGLFDPLGTHRRTMRLDR